MKKTNLIVGKILYAVLFLLIIPAFLILWAKYTEHIVRYPVIDSPLLGWTISIAGAILMLWGMFDLMRYGEGLPMNAFPPEKLVKKGIYRLLRHPIYWGFGMLLFGIFIIIQLASGLWLITPVTILGMISLVIGYEKLDLDKRFQGEKIKTYLGIPDKNENLASLRDRLYSLLLVFSFFLIGNFLILYLEGEQAALFGNSLKISQIFNNSPLFLFSYLYIIGAAFLIERTDQIREWLISLLIALTLSIYISLLWPAVGAQYFFHDFTSQKAIFTFPAAIMSIPLFLILLSMKVYGQYFKKLSILFHCVAIVLCVYQVVNSRSPILHLIVGLIIFIFAANYFRIWMFLKNYSEKLANSWKEWTFGPVRIINHGTYVGIGAFFGILLAGFLTGKTYAWGLLVFSLIVITFSGLWAQLIEGSEKLKRPFGYYGALVGIIFSSLTVWVMGYNVWVIIGIISVFAPWIQAVGRVRCLINGCCHGDIVNNETIGIRYFHPRSRVCGISGLKGKFLHPTQLYAIIWLFFVGFLLLALWINQFSYSLIFGLYLILTGIGRFAEEAYRGEVQTPILKGLRLYQWTAMASIIIGIVMTMIPVAFVHIQKKIGWEIFLAAFIVGLFTFFVMGVDFPRSNSRFSRLV